MCSEYRRKLLAAGQIEQIARARPANLANCASHVEALARRKDAENLPEPHVVQHRHLSHVRLTNRLSGGGGTA
jgi:hypothetical protein